MDNTFNHCTRFLINTFDAEKTVPEMAAIPYFRCNRSGFPYDRRTAPVSPLAYRSRSDPTYNTVFTGPTAAL